MDTRARDKSVEPGWQAELDQGGIVATRYPAPGLTAGQLLGCDSNAQPTGLASSASGDPGGSRTPFSHLLVVTGWGACQLSHRAPAGGHGLDAPGCAPPLRALQAVQR